MSSTPFTSCSIGVATVSAMTSGGAPGYSARTTIVGGTTSGYCATGSETYARAPRMTVTIERTAAKIGRSMKKWESPIALGRAVGAGDVGGAAREHGLLRVDGLAVARELDAARDDPVVGCDPVGDDPEAVDQASELHGAVVGHVRRVDDVDEAVRLVARDRLVGQHDGAVGPAPGQPEAREQARRERQVRVRDDGTPDHRVGLAVELVVDEVHVAVAGEVLLVGEGEVHRGVELP